jgi:hypothetical protein
MPVVVVVDDDVVVDSDLTCPCACLDADGDPEWQAARTIRAATATTGARFIALYLFPRPPRP